VLRVLDKESMSEKFSKLSLDVVGFADSDLVKFRRYIKEPYGMVLVTGPTGSGKTTTLYAGLSEIKNDEDKIITSKIRWNTRSRASRRFRQREKA